MHVSCAQVGSDSQISRAPFPEQFPNCLWHTMYQIILLVFSSLRVLLHLSVTGSEENDPRFKSMIFEKCWETLNKYSNTEYRNCTWLSLSGSSESNSLLSLGKRQPNTKTPIHLE